MSESEQFNNLCDQYDQAHPDGETPYSDWLTDRFLKLQAENAELKSQGLKNIYKIKTLLLGFEVPKLQRILNEWGMELNGPIKTQEK